MDQQKRIKGPEIDAHRYGQLIFDKEANTQWGEGSLLNKWCWENWVSTWKS